MRSNPVSIHADDDRSAALVAGAAAISGEAQDWLEDVTGKFENLVMSRPALALATALAAGVFLGWLIKRR